MAETAELIKRLREFQEDFFLDEGAFSQFLGDAADRLEALQAEVGRQRSDIDKYRERLEVDRHWECGPGTPDGHMDCVFEDYVSADEDLQKYDGIFCRDETIKLLEDRSPSPSVSVEELARVAYTAIAFDVDAALEQEADDPTPVPVWESISSRARSTWLRMAQAVLSHLHLRSGTGNDSDVTAQSTGLSPISPKQEGSIEPAALREET